MLNIPVLVRSLKSSSIELSQYLDGWPPGNTKCCWHLLFFSPNLFFSPPFKLFQPRCGQDKVILFAQSIQFLVFFQIEHQKWSFNWIFCFQQKMDTALHVKLYNTKQYSSTLIVFGRSSFVFFCFFSLQGSTPRQEVRSGPFKAKKCPLLLPTAISCWIYQFSSDHWSQAALSLVSTWMGDRLGTLSVVGISSFFLQTFFFLHLSSFFSQDVDRTRWSFSLNPSNFWSFFKLSTKSDPSTGFFVFNKRWTLHFMWSCTIPNNILPLWLYLAGPALFFLFFFAPRLHSKARSAVWPF